MSRKYNVFDSGMRGASAGAVEDMMGTPDLSGGTDETAQSTRSGEETDVLDKLYASGLRGNEKPKSKTKPIEDTNPATKGKAEPKSAGDNAKVHNSFSVVSEDDDHYMVRMPKKLFHKIGKK